MNKKDTNVKLKPRLVVAITSSLVITSTLLGCIKFILNTTSAPTTEAVLTRRRYLRGGGTYAEAVTGSPDGSRRALEGEPPESWDLTKVTPVKSADDEWVPVPIGFTASKAEGEQEVNKGFVVYEGEVTAADTNAWTEEEAWQASLDKNQFVWIPVENASERIYEANGEKNPKKARLWYFTSTARSVRSQGNGGSKYEPGILASGNYDSLRYLTNYLNYQDYSRDTWYKELQVEYDTAMKSIEKYGGFFIGRYETGNISSNTPVVRRMNTTISNQTWYTMYSRMKNISSNENIQTSMIWGCLWDETLQWLIDTGCKTYADMTNSTSWGNYYNSTFTYKTNTSGGTATKNTNSSKIIPAGSSEYTKANNIYDLAGNVWDWTLEGIGSNYRFLRGGSYSSGRYGQPSPEPWQQLSEQQRRLPSVFARTFTSNRA